MGCDTLLTSYHRYRSSSLASPFLCWYEWIHLTGFIWTDSLEQIHVTKFIWTDLFWTDSCNQIHLNRFTWTDSCNQIHLNGCVVNRFMWSDSFGQIHLNRFIQMDLFEQFHVLRFIWTDSHKQIHLHRFIQMDLFEQIHVIRFIWADSHEQIHFDNHYISRSCISTGYWIDCNLIMINSLGFAFVGFDNPDTVQRLLRIHFHQINGRTV